MEKHLQKLLKAYVIIMLLVESGTMKLFAQNYPQGAIHGVFSVAENYYVFFSQGNLQYKGSAASPYWKFADHQWDYLGDNGQGSDATNVDRDLFCWGTSGYNHGAVCYQPWSISSWDTCYYAYGSYNYNLYDQTGQADWGYNAIVNGSNTENSNWRTPTNSEWKYVLFDRIVPSGIRFAHGTVNNINGVIILPDDWSESYYYLYNTNSYGFASYNDNIITASQWTTLEQHGAVFLPAAGMRVYNIMTHVGLDGYYWSSSYHYSSYYNTQGAYNISFVDWGLNGYNDNNHGGREIGSSVRLVYPVGNMFYGINISPNPSYGGSVSGGGIFTPGTNCTLTATPSAGYSFVSWTENGNVVSTNSNYSFTVNSNRTLVANFTMANYQIIATTNPANSGTITGTGNYNYGATAVLTVTPNTNYVFVNWTENGTVVSTSPTYYFVVAGNRNLVANLMNMDGIEETENDAFAIYPNPANDIVFINSEKEISSCEIYSLSGRLVYTKSDCQKEMQINVGELPIGSYIIRIVADDSVYTKRFVKH